MFRDFIDRENEIFRIIKELVEIKKSFVVIGGYAVSAYKHRFSVDLDATIKKEDLVYFESTLKRKNYKKITQKELENYYTTEFIRYENKEFKTSVDLMVNGIGIRQTEGCISFEKLFRNSVIKKIIGTEMEVKVRVLTKEMLIATKLHSGRLTDYRDVVALLYNVDIRKIEQLVNFGNTKVVRGNIEKLLYLLKKQNFVNSFKGVFVEKEPPDFEKISKQLNYLLFKCE